MTIKKINITIDANSLIGSIELPKSMIGLNIPTINELENYTVLSLDVDNNEVINDVTVSNLSGSLLASYNDFKNAFITNDVCQVIIDLDNYNKRIIINKSNAFIDISKSTILDYDSMTVEQKNVLDDFITANSI